MKSFLIIGKNIEVDQRRLQKSYKENGNSLTIYGDKINLVDCSNLSLPKNAHVMIWADGKSLSSTAHYMTLCSIGQETESTLGNIANKKVINFELISCYSGAAINHINKLPIGSSLITLADENYPIQSVLMEEIITKMSELINANNPFTRFVNYFILNPNKNKFSINTLDGPKFFISDIKTLEDFTNEGIIEWKKKQILKFTAFCKSIVNDLPKAIQKNIQKTLDVLTYEEKLLSLFEEFDVERFKEYLINSLASKDDAETIEKLLVSGVNIEAKLEKGVTPLYTAAMDNSINALQLLWSKGANISVEVSDNRQTPFWIAIAQNSLKAAEFLYSKGANINWQNNKGFTPLLVSTELTNLKAIKFLCKKEADLNLPNDLGITPLLMAVDRGDINIVKFLLKKGAEVDLANNEGLTPLMRAVQIESLDILLVLYKNAAKIDIANEHGNSPLFYAAQNGDIAITQFLLQKEVNIDRKCQYGATALHIAIQNKKYDIVEALINAGADVEADLRGATPILQAAAAQDYEATKILLSSGVNTNLKYQGKKYIDLIESSEIIKEIKSYNKAPIKYILKNNNDANIALMSLQKIKNFSNKPSLLYKIQKTEICLEAQHKHEDLDLNVFCGENGTWDHYEL